MVEDLDASFIASGSKEIIERTERHTLEGKIKECIAIIKLINGEEITDEEKRIYKIDESLSPERVKNNEDLNELMHDLSKIRVYLEDTEMEKIILLNEYMKANSDEDIIGNFLGPVFPTLKRLMENKTVDPKLIEVIGKKAKNILKLIEFLSKAKLRAA